MGILPSSARGSKDEPKITKFSVTASTDTDMPPVTGAPRSRSSS